MFPRVRSGQRINHLPAAAVNGLFGLLESKNRRETKGSGTGKTGDAIEILIKNKTGSPLAASFGIVAVGNVVFTKTDSEATFYSEHIFEGNTPTATSTKIAIVQEPLSADAIGKAIVQGVATVRLNVTASGDTHASPTTSVTELTTGTSGIAQILWKEAGTGAGKWAKVLLHNVAPPILDYEGYTLELDVPITVAVTAHNLSAGGWRRASDNVLGSHPYIPSTGIWFVIANVTGEVESTGSSGGAADTLTLYGELGVGNTTAILTPLTGGQLGIVACAITADAAGVLRGRGTGTISGIFSAGGGSHPDIQARMLWDGLGSTGNGTVFRGTPPGSVSPNGVTSVSMYKLSD